ncbi:4Fe-4S binding protein [Chloroflexota bacterium]
MAIYMEINSLNLIYFSPTGTTKKIVENIALGMKVSRMEHSNFTLPSIISVELDEITDGLAIVGAPVYGGRIPLEAVDRFKRLRANDMPTILVVVYGNREYEDALLELTNITREQGLKPIAGGAFVGEHSLSNKDMPIAEGRPDEADINQAQQFGKEIRDLLIGIDSVNNLSPLNIPGNFPYKERRAPLKIAPFIDEMLCTKCESCISVCPTGVITINEVLQINSDNCIRCCACIRSCPSEALYFSDPIIKRTAETLYKNCSKRKEPEMYISAEM